MNLANSLVIVILCVYIVHLLNIMFFKQKSIIQNRNLNLDKLREVKIKTIEQQKEFIKAKYKRGTPFNFFNFIKKSVIYIVLFFIFNYIFNYLNINLKLYQTILFIILFPLLINIILRRFHLENDDLFFMLK